MAAVVLNWNGAEETIACIESLKASDWTRLTTIVVDNGSDDDIGPALTQADADSILIRNRANLGFAGGMNAGIRRALELDADFVLLLNNDTLVDPAMVRLLVEAAVEHPDAGIVTPLEFFRDAPDVVASAGRRCNLRRAYQGPPLHVGERDAGQFHGTQEVDTPSGTAMLVPTAVIREVGPLDEALFLYIEDVDWAMRIRQAGKRVYVSFDARLWHGVATASGGEDSPQVTYYHARNTFIVSARHLPLRGPRGAVRHLEILFANLTHALRCRRPLANVWAVLEGWRDYIQHRFGPRAAPPEQIQHDFYTATASEYDRAMVEPGDEHDVSLELISALIDGFGYRSVLDVGTGTGRGMRHFLSHHDGIEVRGVEPVRAMIEQAESSNGIPAGSIAEARGSELPFDSNSFDVVCEFGVLHHVEDPNAIVAEMARVARRAVFLSDSNRFGGGGPLRRMMKLVLHNLGLWSTAYRLANRGRRYHVDDTDGGIVYSYSVYDSLASLNEWADRTFLVPIGPARANSFHPLFGTKTVLLCALRDEEQT